MKKSLFLTIIIALNIKIFGQFTLQHFDKQINALISDSTLNKYIYKTDSLNYFQIDKPFFHINDPNYNKCIDSNYFKFISYKSPYKRLDFMINDSTKVLVRGYSPMSTSHTINFPILYFTHISRLKTDSSFYEVRVVLDDSFTNTLTLDCYRYIVVLDSNQKYYAKCFFQYKLLFDKMKINDDYLWTFGLPSCYGLKKED